MSRVLIDEIHVRLYVPRNLRAPVANAVRRTIDGRRFRDRLGRAIRTVLREFDDLRPVQVRIAR